MFMDIKDLKIAKASTPKTFNTYFKKISSSYEIPNWWKSILNNVDPSTAYSDYVSSVQSVLGSSTIGDNCVYLGNWSYDVTSNGSPRTWETFNSGSTFNYAFSYSDTLTSLGVPRVFLASFVAPVSGSYAFTYFDNYEGSTFNIFNRTLSLLQNNSSIGSITVPYGSTLSKTFTLVSGVTYTVSLKTDFNLASPCSVTYSGACRMEYPTGGLAAAAGTTDVSSETRTGSLCGDYTYTDSNNKLKEVKNIFIFDEANKILNNPQAGTSIAISSWTYDYTTRTYTATGTDNLTYIVSYSDNNVTIASTSTTSNMVAGATTEYVYTYGNINDLTGVYKKATFNVRDASGNVNTLYPVTSIRVISEFPDFDTATDGQVLIKSGDGLVFTDNVALDSPNFTGIPTAPTATKGTNTTQLATTAFVYTAIGGTDIDLAAMTVWEVFDPIKAYVPQNKVYHNGSSYICKEPVTGGDPSTDTDHWELIAQKGANGSAGIYVGDTAPTDPDIYVWLTQTGDPSPVIPNGGNTNQVLAKNSNTNYDFKWVDQFSMVLDSVPTEGSTNSVTSGGVYTSIKDVDNKTKNGFADYDTGWQPSQSPFTFYTEAPTYENGALVPHGTATVETSISAVMSTDILQGKVYMTDAGYSDTYFFMSDESASAIVQRIISGTTTPIPCVKITFKSNGSVVPAINTVTANSLRPVNSIAVSKYAAGIVHASTHAIGGSDVLKSTDLGIDSTTAAKLINNPQTVDAALSSLADYKVNYLPINALSASDLNNAAYPNSYETGIVAADAVAIGLPSGYYVFKYLRWGSNDGNGVQTASLNGTNIVYYRGSNGTTWNPWTPVGSTLIATGSYTGTGTYGSGNPITLSFGIDAKLLILMPRLNDAQFIGVSPIVIPAVKSVAGAGMTLATYAGTTISLIRSSDDVSANTSLKFYCSGAADAGYANPNGKPVNWLTLG